MRLTSEITVRLVQKAGGDEMVVAAARVSTSGEDALRWASAPASENAGLIRYLVRKRHGSCLEHSLLTFFVHAPQFVWWEWVRHRVGHSYNLESSRYRVLEPVFWVPRRDRPMVPAPNHKPAHPSFVTMLESLTAGGFEPEDDPHGKAMGWYDDALREMGAAYQKCWDAYQSLIRSGVACEVARACLPSAVYFSGWVTVNPRSLMHFLSLRTRDERAACPSSPQAEIEEAARACEKIFMEGWPITHAAFNEYGRVAP